MNHQQGHEYAHNIARNYNPDDYEDVYQQAWLYILEAQESGAEGQECYWDARMRTNLWVNYRNRLVTLPARTGSRDLAEEQEVESEVYEHINPYKDHAEAYELRDEIRFLKENMEYLNKKEKKLLQDVYGSGMSFRDMEEKYGQTYEMWRKRHNKILRKLKSCQEPK